MTEQETTDGVLTAAAIAKHKTDTSDATWDGPKQESNLSNDAGAATYKKAYAWVDPDKDADTKAAYSFIHHFVDADGNVGDASTKASSTGIGVLNGGRGGTKIPDADRQGVYDHLAKHLVDSGVDKDDLPKLMAREMTQFFAAQHGPTTGTHSHAHPSYGKQGNDATHDHTHTHAGDAHHGHDHAMKTPARPQVASMSAGQNGFVASAHLPGEAEAGPDERFVESLVASGARWGIQQRGDEWTLFNTQGEAETNFGSYHDATGWIAEQLATGDSPNTLPERWRSDMSFEGVDTGDGRSIDNGATRFRDTPLPLMLQTETEIGHFGAVLAGTIESCGMVGSTAVGEGSFFDFEAGRQFRDILLGQGKFGVSIDIGESEAEFECTMRDPEYDDCIDGTLKFTLAEVMGLTGTPFPAFAGAYIELQANTATPAQPVAAAGECAECDEAAGVASPVVQMAEGIVAAGGPTAPPEEWFKDPAFAVGDERLVRQPNGGFACPLTVTPEGRVFGHIAAHASCHTSYSDRCVPPPKSPSGYAYFTTGAITTAEGTTVRVGQLTMGAGHASTDARTTPAEVKAHYDGGPGAVQMADVAAGEDEFGIWVAGSLRSGVTDEQVRAFTACNLSGDWREVARGKGLDLLAVAAGIPVPGFPITRAIAAAAVPEGMDVNLPDTKATFVDGRPVALVAAGVIRQPMPWERAMAAQQAEIDKLTKRLQKAERVTNALRAEAAANIRQELVAAG